MENISFRIKRISLIETEFGNDICIKMVQIYKDGKFVRNAKINADLIEVLKNSTIIINLDQTKKKYLE